VILAGDLGGTKCNLALIEQRDRKFQVLYRHHYSSHSYTNFAAMLADFLRDSHDVLDKSSEKVQAAGFGVAGPVLDGSVHLTNLGWNLKRAELAEQLGVPHIALLNDLEATGYCLPWLAPQEICVINAGTAAPQVTCALIAAGTGLGEAILRWDGTRYVVEPSEGGHCDFAPRTDQEIELLRYMKKTPGPVAFELILSGRGFYAIHQFLNPQLTHASFAQGADAAAPEITELGLAGTCPTCVETLSIWTALYGAEAGNLALKALARGGVFVAGGIAPKILPKMKDGTFVKAFCEKDKFAELLSHIPIQIVLNEEAPLLGAAAEAARLLNLPNQ
jgi:glucokinase